MKKTIQALSVLVFAMLCGTSLQAMFFHVRNKSDREITVRFEAPGRVKSMVVPAGERKHSPIEFKQPTKIVISEHAGEMDRFGRPLYTGAQTTITPGRSRKLWKKHIIVYHGPDAYDYKQGWLR